MCLLYAWHCANCGDTVEENGQISCLHEAHNLDSKPCSVPRGEDGLGLVIYLSGP